MTCRDRVSARSPRRTPLPPHASRIGLCHSLTPSSHDGAARPDDGDLHLDVRRLGRRVGLHRDALPRPRDRLAVTVALGPDQPVAVVVEQQPHRLAAGRRRRGRAPPHRGGVGALRQRGHRRTRQREPVTRPGHRDLQGAFPALGDTRRARRPWASGAAAGPGTRAAGRRRVLEPRVDRLHGPRRRPGRRAERPRCLTGRTRRTVRCGFEALLDAGGVRARGERHEGEHGEDDRRGAHPARTRPQPRPGPPPSSGGTGHTWPPRRTGLRVHPRVTCPHGLCSSFVQAGPVRSAAGTVSSADGTVSSAGGTGDLVQHLFEASGHHGT